MFGEPMCGEALRPPARRRSADEQKFWSDIRVDGSGDDTNGRPGRLQSYSYSHSSVRRADGSVSGRTMGEYVDHAGRKEHSRERRVGDTRIRVTCSCRSCNAGNVWKLTCKNLYSHVAVLALLAGHGTLRVTAATATCNCK